MNDVNTSFCTALPETPTTGPYRTALPSRGSRAVPRRGGGSFRVHTMLFGHAASLESLTEHRVAAALSARSDIVDLVEQQPCVRYVDPRRREVRRHTFDFLATFADGSRIAIEVKPAHLARRHAVGELVAEIARQMDPRVATGAMLVTDEDVTPAMALAAERLSRARARPDASRDDAVFALATAALTTPVTAGTLKELTGLGSRTIFAIERAVGDGRLAHIPGPGLGLFARIDRP